MAEQRLGPAAEQQSALVEGFRSGRSVGGQPLDDPQYLVERSEHVRLATAERGETEPGEGGLEIAVVVAAELEVGTHVRDAPTAPVKRIVAGGALYIVAKGPQIGRDGHDVEPRVTGGHCLMPDIQLGVHYLLTAPIDRNRKTGCREISALNVSTGLSGAASKYGRTMRTLRT